MGWKIGSVLLIILLVGGMLLFAYRHSSCPLSDSGLCVGPCPAFIDHNGDGICDRAEAADGTERAAEVACPFGRVNDPYPGQCNRYVDSNHNGLCDLSEPGFVPEEGAGGVLTTTEPMLAGDTTTATVACPFGQVNDPYPGQCNRYVDSNHNGLCDLSEPGFVPEEGAGGVLTTTEPMLAGSTTTATVACPFGRVNDPYPGQCNRYVDSNHNGLCDLSEPGFVPEEDEEVLPTPTLLHQRRYQRHGWGGGRP